MRSLMVILATSLVVVAASGCGGEAQGGLSGSGGSAGGDGTSSSSTGSSSTGGGSTGDGGAGGGGAGGGGAGGGGGAAVGPAFSEVYEQVFKAGGCTNGYCHLGSSLKFATEESAYESLIGVASSGDGCGEATRVMPGDPEQSLIYLKVTMTTPPCGKQMPLASPPLEASQVELLRAWIEAGAHE